MEDHTEYCYYVAGLLGFGLSKLFLASGLEVLTPDWEQLSNSMGLFLHVQHVLNVSSSNILQHLLSNNFKHYLQKTHIIKDYLEDINEIPEPRKFWPRQIWSKYVGKLEDFKDEENSTKAVQCLNYMVTDALIHIEDCFKYMAALRDPTIFRFCAIPQVREIYYHIFQIF